MNTEKLWTKDFVTVSVINFLVFLVHFLLIVTIAAYAVDKFQASTSLAGLVAGIFIIGALIGRLGAGRLTEITGSKKILMIGTILFIITSLLYFAAVNLTLLIIVRLFNGIAYGVASTATGAIVAQIIPDHRRGEGIGYYSLGAILAVALGPFLGILALHYLHSMMIFVVASVLAFVSFVLSFWVADRAAPRPEPARPEAKEPFQISRYLELTALPISLVALTIGVSYSVVLAFMSLYAADLHLEKAASFYFLVYSLAVLVSRPFSGRLLDVRGANIVMYPCLLIYSAGMLLFSQANHGIALLAAGVINGLGYGNFISCAQAISIKGIPAKKLGLATSTFFIFVDLGFGAGPYLLGSLIPYTGYRGLYLAMIALILAAIVLYHFLLGKKAQAPASPDQPVSCAWK
ncbi:MAG: MFS transporter [Deltaproteobacteria bacterium]|nr:MFS transporter [Deltaproteobacteria bacterium]